MNNKFSLAELKKAIAWIESNTNHIHVKIENFENKLRFTSFDRGDQEVVITLFSDETMMAKVKRTENL